ncbi:MAG: nickel pincer cofactor biosynthesis protein LarC [Myxococcales bacterium]|nr:nickel pincer cofactor biosynthesis protein LarC [Myxococcales bacterium]
MTRLAYFDCFSGLAGDMALGALIDLGLDVDTLRAALRTLPLEGWTLDCAETRKMGLRAVDVKIRVGGRTEGPAVPANPSETEPHDHAHHEHDHHHHGHGHDDAHAHGPPADHDPHDHHHHAHFHYADIVRILEGGHLPAPVVRRACAAFDALAEAEGRVHGVPKEAVHFHEVGAVDSILDIAGVTFGLWKLGIDRIESAPPPIGRGFIRCAHGRMPLPAPATLELLRGMPIEPCALRRELVTPTGAAFIRAWAERVGDFPEMVVEGVGWGAGDADFDDRPNLLRVVLGRAEPAETACTVIEANLDDLNPELAGHLLDRLLHAGALDAWFVPVHMKKNRPGIIVGALADRGHAAAVEELLLAESSAIGLRRFPVTRHKLDRSVHEVGTPFGNVLIKIAYRGDQIVNIAPEYEACAAVARTAGVPLKTVYQHAIAAWLDRTPR